MNVDVALRQHLLMALPGVAVQQNTIDESSPLSRIWYRRSGESTEKGCGEIDGKQVRHLTRTDYDVECVADTPDVADYFAAAIKDQDGYTGYLGAGDVFALDLSVEDHSDDYSPRNLGADEGLHVAALRLTVSYRKGE